MEECIRDKFEETGKGALKTDGKKHGRMLWRHVGEEVKVCRRQIGGNRKGCIRDKLHLHYKHLKELENSLNLIEREAIEEGWMKRLNTIYPYGLNVRTKTCGVMDAVKEVEGSNNVIYGKFEKIDIRRHHRGGGQSNNSTDFDAELLISELINPPTLRNLRTKITQLNQEKLKLVYLASITSLIRCTIEEKVFLRVIKDLCLYRCKL